MVRAPFGRRRRGFAPRAWVKISRAGCVEVYLACEDSGHLLSPPGLIVSPSPPPPYATHSYCQQSSIYWYWYCCINLHTVLLVPQVFGAALRLSGSPAAGAVSGQGQARSAATFPPHIRGWLCACCPCRNTNRQQQRHTAHPIIKTNCINCSSARAQLDR